ncbi:hypothetical protein SORBI_3008G088450 [Sorghum bicolor]|uniref:Uncharacterized protein n=1 Tax=Sorghum bicolor TaxID=4558 RepID=A0A1Z5R5G2_SORBI|nr:hypothetical protein SORBI_3008G088450 [Sorghum bicolor]
MEKRHSRGRCSRPATSDANSLKHIGGGGGKDNRQENGLLLDGSAIAKFSLPYTGRLQFYI